MSKTTKGLEKHMMGTRAEARLQVKPETGASSGVQGFRGSGAQGLWRSRAVTALALIGCDEAISIPISLRHHTVQVLISFGDLLRRPHTHVLSQLIARARQAICACSGGISEHYPPGEVPHHGRDISVPPKW